MPHAVIAFVGVVVEGAVSVLTAVGLSSAAAVAVIDFGIKMAALSFVNSLIEDLVGKPDLATSASSFNVTVRGTIEHQRIIYGETLCSGTVWFMDTTGTNNEDLYQGIALAGHEVEDITDIWLDDVRIPGGYIDWGTGDVNSGDFRGHTDQPVVANFKKFLGTSSQAAPSDMVAEFTSVTSAHRGQGITWLQTKFTYVESNSQVWSRGSPTNIKPLVKGKKVYDPRSDSSQSFGYGPHRVDSESTWEWSDNPALCWADYLIDQSVGFKEDYANVDYGYVASAAEICDGIVYTPVGTDKRFRCNGVLSTGDSHENNLKRILSAMNGMGYISNGKWKCRAWGYNTPTLQFNEDDLRGDAQIKLTVDESQRFNTVRGYFIDKDRQWQTNQFPEHTSSEYIVRDGGNKLYRDISLDMTKETYAAQRLALGILEQSDLGITAIFPFNYKSLPAELGGTVAYSSTKMNWTNKEFRVMQYKFRDLGGIDLICHEESAGAYSDVGTSEYRTLTATGYTMSSPTVPSPSSLTVLPHLEGLLLTVTPPPARLYEYIKFYASNQNSRDQAVLISEVRGKQYYYPVATQTNQYFWSKAVDYVGRESSWFPNSGQTGVISRVSSAIGLVYSESGAEVTVTSAWASAVNLVSVGINPGGDFNFRTDISVETLLYHKGAMLNTNASIRVRYAVGTPQNWQTLGFTRDLVVNSSYPEYHVLKRSLQSNVATNHYFAVQAIANYGSNSQWIASSYSNITAKLVPQARTQADKMYTDYTQIYDAVVASYIPAPVPLTIVSASDITDSEIGASEPIRVPATGYAYTTVVISGGTPPYTVVWSKFNDAYGSDFICSNRFVQNAGWYGNRPGFPTGGDDVEGWSIHVTDDDSNTAVDSISIQLRGFLEP